MEKRMTETDAQWKRKKSNTEEAEVGGQHVR